jgi:hypothetical protein
MTDNNGWPGKPGVPPNPDWTGAHHWLSYQGEEPGLYEWDGKYWKMGGGHAPMDYVVDHFTYIAPVLTPAEGDARVMEALLEAADLCDQLSEHTGGICAIAIREMADPAKSEGND